MALIHDGFYKKIYSEPNRYSKIG